MIQDIESEFIVTEQRPEYGYDSNIYFCSHCSTNCMEVSGFDFAARTIDIIVPSSK